MMKENNGIVVSSSSSSSSSLSNYQQCCYEDGNLVVTIYSVYDIPDEYGSVRNVRVEVMDSKVLETGPPSGRHREQNSFKFSSNHKNTNPTSLRTNPGNNINNNDNSGVEQTTKQINPIVSRFSTNQMSILAPLESLYPLTITFRVICDNDNNDYWMTNLTLKSTLKINETKWLVLDLIKTTTASKRTATAATMDNPYPTMRLKMTLYGSYRPFIINLFYVFNQWFQFVDDVTDNFLAPCVLSPLQSILVIFRDKNMIKHNNNLWLLLIPMISMIVMSPVVMGLLLILLPIILPIITILFVFSFATLFALLGFWLSTRHGRTIIGTALAPAVSTFSHTSFGQHLFYNTGPLIQLSSSPIDILRKINLLPSSSSLSSNHNDIHKSHSVMWGKLLISLTTDLIGNSSYLLPILGETLDIFWAPIQTMILMSMYLDVIPALKYVYFMEEFLPFTDIVPSGMIAWIIEYGPFLCKKKRRLKQRSAHRNNQDQTSKNDSNNNDERNQQVKVKYSSNTSFSQLRKPRIESI